MCKLVRNEDEEGCYTSMMLVKVMLENGYQYERGPGRNAQGLS